MRNLTVLLLGLWAAAGLAHADSENFEKKVPADPHGVVEVSNVSGRTDISAWDNAEVEVKGNLGGGVDRVDVTSNHGRTIIKVIVPNHTFRSGSADLQIRVPRDSELDVSGVSSDVISTDVEGALQLRTVSGNVRTDVFSRSADVKTVSGDVVIRGRKEGSGIRIHVATISGNIRVDHTGGDLDASTVSGDMNVRLDPTRSVRVRTTSGDLGFEGRLAKGASMEAETVSGDMIIRVVPEAGLDYEINTFSGEIRNCMGEEAERVSKYGPGRRLSGARGKNSADEARIRLKSMSGDVELCDKG